MSEQFKPKRLFLTGQTLKILTGVQPDDRHFHIFGEDAKRAPSERDQEREAKNDPWQLIESRDELCRDAALKSPPMKRVGLVCDAGLGKTANMEWLAAHIAGEKNSQQLPFLLKLFDSKQNRIDLDLLMAARTSPSAILDELAARIAVDDSSDDPKRLLAALRRYQRDGRITLLIDGLDHALTEKNVGAAVKAVVESPQWRNCPIWISGRSYAFEECWKLIFEPQHDWQFLRVEPLPVKEIRRYLLKHAGGDYSNAFDAAAWNLLAIPRFLLLMSDLIRNKTAKAKSPAEKEAIVRGLKIETAADLYYLAYFRPEYYDTVNQRCLLGQGADVVNKHDIAIGGWLISELGEQNYPDRIKRMGVVLGAIALRDVRELVKGWYARTGYRNNRGIGNQGAGRGSPGDSQARRLQGTRPRSRHPPPHE